MKSQFLARTVKVTVEVTVEVQLSFTISILQTSINSNKTVV